MLVDSEFCVRLCETLLHSLWQGVAIAIVAFAVGRLMRRRPARARYGVFVLALAAAAVLPAVTFVWLGGRRAPAPVAAAPPPAAALEVAVPASGAVIQESPANMAPKPSAKAAAARREFNLRDYSAWFAAAYAAGVAAMIAHLLFALRGGVRLRRKSRLITEPALTVSLTRAAESIGAKFMPALAWCERVGAPTVVGVIRPAILIPLSLANGLSTEQVELLLMHELAHLRRHDHWVNLAQRVVEALYFFNPAVWIISRRIRTERELACDDMVLGAGAKQAAYADSLLRIAELTRGRVASALALGATGSPLGRRILRIVGHPSHEQVRMNRVWPIATALALLVALGVFSRGGKVWADDAKKDYSLQEILSGIAAHEARIHSAEFDLTMQFLASNDFPSVPAKPVVEHHVVWDSNFNVTVTGKVIGYDLRNLSADAKYDTWTENRSWDHKRAISTRSDKKEGFISAGREIFGSFYSPTTPLGAMGYWSVSNGPELTLGGTLEKYGAAFATPKKEIVDGRETYVIEMMFPKSPDDPSAPKDLTKRFYICPELQFSPIKIVFLFKGVIQGEWIVQYATIDGIAFPIECRETRWIPAGNKKGRELSPPARIQYSNIKLNQSTPRAIEIPDDYTTFDFTKRDFQKESEPERIRVETQAREAVHDAATTGSFVWGKEVNGLRAAFELVPEKKDYALGEIVGVRFHVQNVSSQPVKLITLQELSFWPTFIDASGKPAMFAGVWTYNDSSGIPRTIKPGETAVFKSFGFGFRSGKINTGAHINGDLDAVPGKYSVSYTLNFSDKYKLPTGSIDFALNFPRVAKTPDNPLGLTDDLLRKLYETGQGMRQIMAAVQSYQNDHNGSVPEHIEDLGHYLPMIPKDPFSSHKLGGPMKLDYIKTTDKVRVYSCGPDEAYLFNATPTGGALLLNIGERKPIDSADPFLKGDLGIEYDPRTKKIRYLADDTFTDYLKNERLGPYLAAKDESNLRAKIRDAETSGTIAWGKAIDGLRAGIELTTKKSEYTEGDRIRVRFHVQNVSPRTIHVSSSLWRPDDVPIVRDVNGDEIALEHMSYSEEVRFAWRTLGPGETAYYNGVPLGIGKSTREIKPRMPNVANVLDAPTGQYSVGFNMKFPDVMRTSARNPNENVPQPGDWQGTLITGEVAVKIKTYTRAERPNKPGEKLIFHGIDLTTAPLARKSQLGSVLRSKDVVIPYDSVQGSVYYAPSKSVYFVQYNRLGANDRDWYGPFDGDPTAAMDGVAVTLRGDEETWNEGSEPTFKIDLRTARERTLPHYGPPLDDFLVDLDGKLYRSAKPEFFHGLRSVFSSPATERKGLVFRLRPQDWVRDDATSASMVLAPGKHRVRVRLSLKDNYREDAISNEVACSIVSSPEPPSPNSVESVRQREITEWFQRFARGERDTSQTLPTKMGMHGITRDDLAWSDIPILLELAQDSTLISLEHATMPSSMASSYAQRQGRAGTVALWMIERLRRRELNAKGAGPLNPICVKGDLKFSECEASEAIHQEALAAYREWWSQAQSISSAEAAKIDPLAWTDLNWFGTQSGPRVISGWGKPDGGVQVRLAAERESLNSSEMPKLLVEVRNTGEHKYTFTPNSVFFEIEYDGEWYAPAVIKYVGSSYVTYSKEDRAEQIPVAWEPRYVRKRDGAPLKLAGGRHTIRIAVPMEPSPKDPSSTQIRSVSDPITLQWAGKQ